ncbi:MAG: hypothetical protein WBP64_18335 [Nitrososphaeraceae archaeon]
MIASHPFIGNDHPSPSYRKAAELIRDRQIMELRILLAHSILEKEVYKYTVRLKRLQEIKSSSGGHGLYEPMRLA